MPQFSTHELVSLEKDVESKKPLVVTNLEAIDELYEVEKCVEWIRNNSFQKVCLQFPDHLLPDSTDVALKLQAILAQSVYVLGDTSYESCCIDYVAAAHVDADAIIHFGPTCFSKTSGDVPYLNIYEKHSLQIDHLEAQISQIVDSVEGKDLVIVLDDAYIHYFDALRLRIKNAAVHKVVEDTLDVADKNVVFISENQRKLINIGLGFKPKTLYLYDPSKPPSELTLFQDDQKILKRRYFLMEKIRDARTIGIVIGTLGVKNYLKIIERVKNLATAYGKKYYLISVGKPTVAKLANLGEIDIYVMITCAMNEIYDSRDFYKPIVTPYDVEVALNSNAKIHFTYDYNGYLNNLDEQLGLAKNENETDVSLLTGRLRSNAPTDESIAESSSDSQLAVKGNGSLSVCFGAGYLSDRFWKGLEQNLGATDVKLAEKGRNGIAQAYDNETH